MKILTEVSSMEELMEILEKEEIQYIILDINLPRESGYVGIGKILKIYPDAKIIMFSAMPNEVYARKCFEAGAKGYLSKQVACEELIEAIKKVAKGGTYTGKISLQPDKSFPTEKLP
jgi:DNA-binding NarL/FixJ family response regulator